MPDELNKKINSICVSVGQLTTVIENLTDKVDEIKAEHKEDFGSLEERVDGIEKWKSFLTGGWVVTTIIFGFVAYIAIQYANVLIEKKVEAQVEAQIQVTIGNVDEHIRDEMYLILKDNGIIKEE